jgi:magnesium-transporting ATPase (P-type)
LMSANIRLWVLTGDKQETAIEIGKACHLIAPESEIYELVDLSERSESKFVAKLQNKVDEL